MSSDTGNDPRGELLQRLLYTDIKTYLVELLMKQDNMSMAASIESRVPFLDHVLVEFATRIPASIQIRGMRRQVDPQKSDGRPASSFDHLPAEVRVPHALEWLAGGHSA